MIQFSATIVATLENAALVYSLRGKGGLLVLSLLPNANDEQVSTSKVSSLPELSSIPHCPVLKRQTRVFESTQQTRCKDRFDLSDTRKTRLPPARFTRRFGQDKMTPVARKPVSRLFLALGHVRSIASKRGSVLDAF